MIKVKNITKNFGKNKVLENISFEIKDGECIGLLGSNGCGKTTLLEIIIGQIKPTSGEVLIDNSNNTYNKIGIQFQEGVWPKGVTSKQIIGYFKRKSFVLKDPDVKKMIDIFEIEDFLHKDLNSLSGGQKQRLNTLLAVINNPNYICLDEMITGLDLKMQLKLIEYFKKLKKLKKTIIIVSHNPEEIEELCDRLIILQDGKIFFEAKTKKVIKEFGSVRSLMIDYYNERLKNNA